jgi:hypothetical protein
VKSRMRSSHLNLLEKMRSSKASSPNYNREGNILTVESVEPLPRSAPRFAKIARVFLVATLLLVARPAGASNLGVSITLDPNFPTDYFYFTYTDSTGAPQSTYVAPYLATLTDQNGNVDVPVYLICYDYNNPTYVGETYTGQYQYLTATNQTDPGYATYFAYMEATYLANLLALDGQTSAGIAVQGGISMAIWEVMFPSSTDSEGGPMPLDPAAQQYITQASTAVTNGWWTVAAANRYPTFIPDDTTAQRFGGVFQANIPIANITNITSSTPEPGSPLLLGAGLVGVALLGRRRARTTAH